MKITQKNIFVILAALTLFISGFYSCFAKEIIASGTAYGPADKASEMALADALRNAVREGAGVDLISSSKVSDFSTEYDYVLTSSYGYVQHYTIVEQGYDPENLLYTVQIKADVIKNAPQVNNRMALKLLIQRVGAPRVIVKSQDDIEGFKNNDLFIESIIENIAKESGFSVYNRKSISSFSKRQGLRSGLLGDELNSKVKMNEIQSNADFEIIADVKGYIGPLKEPFPNVKVRDVALGVTLQAVTKDTGEVLASVVIPVTMFRGENNMQIPFEMPGPLVRYYLNNLLTGKDKNSKDKNAYLLLNKIVAKWITELDLGTKIKVEFKSIDRQLLNKIIAQLKENKQINQIWIREYDHRLFSTLEIESRLTSSQLEDAILKICKNNYYIDLATKRNLIFLPEKKAG